MVRFRQKKFNATIMESLKGTPGNTDQNSNTAPQALTAASTDIPLDNFFHQNSELGISECMERLGTRLSMLETELKYAWRALDLLSQEYVKMWRRLEKLEGLLYEQQTVITQLLDFYSNVERQNNQLGGAEGEPISCEDSQAPITGAGLSETTSELDALQEALNLVENTARENELSEVLSSSSILSGASGLSVEASEIIKELQLEDMMHSTDEAFYRSLNKAYREDLVDFDPNFIGIAAAAAAAAAAPSQLGMIWEEAEEADENGGMSSKRDVSNELNMSSLGELRHDNTCDVFSALDYKDYKNSVPNIQEGDLSHLSRLNPIDQVALEKLHELDRLTDKLQKDSKDLKDLQNRLMEKEIKSPLKKVDPVSKEDQNFSVEDTELINDQTRQIFSDAELENWNFSDSPRGLSDMLLLAGITSNQKPKAEVLVTDSTESADVEVATTLSGYRSISSTSPRHIIDNSYSTSPRMSGLLSSDRASPKHPSDLQNYSYYPAMSLPSKRVADTEAYSYTNLTGSPKHTVDIQNFSYGSSSSPKLSEYQGFSYGMNVSGIASTSYPSVSCTSPSMYSASSGKLSSSPTLSIISVRTRQDGFRPTSGRGDLLTSSPSPTSPPPPAPEDKDIFIMSSSVEPSLTSSVALFGTSGASSSITSLSLDQQQGRLTPKTPHSPKSPRASPKRIVKSTSSNIAAAKSDSGLSSMSGGWSSLEKSPGSPKSSKVLNTLSYASSDTGTLIGRVPCYSHSRSQSATHLNTSPKHLAKPSYKQESDLYSYGRTLSPLPATPVASSSMLPGGHHLSAFTSVRTPTFSSPSVTNDSSGTFVPSPAPSSDVSSSPSRRSQRLSDFQQIEGVNDYTYRSEKPAIYSVAGSHRQPYTSVFTSGSSNYATNVTNLGYPDLIGTYPFNDNHSGSSSSSQYLAGSEHGTSRSHSTSTSIHPTPTTTPTQYLSSKSGAKNYGAPDAYKSLGYRNVFPSGQFNDALSYYPTSAHGTSMPANVPTTYYQSPNQWLSQSLENQSQIPQRYDRDFNRYSYEGSYPKKSLMDPSAQYRAEEGYPIRDYQWSRRDWNSELDIRNQNDYDRNDRYTEPQGYDANGVIVSKSGYISIASGVREDSNGFEKTPKKSKKTGNLKSAMSSVSNWLPDLHLTKRHRSNSLPGNEFLERSEPKPKTSLKGKLQKQLSNTLTKRKVGKSHIVNTVTGIIQKAKKKVAHTSHSLSDSEQSAMEWGSPGGVRSGRTSSMSCRSEDSVFSEPPADIFAKVPQKTDVSDEVNEEQTLDIGGALPELDLPVYTDEGEDEPEEKIPSSVSALFPTVGEIKVTTTKSTTGSSDESVTSESARKYSQVSITGPPREFAVSRALGKYRQRQSSTVSDDVPVQEDGNHSGNGNKENFEKTAEEAVEIETNTESVKENMVAEEKKPIIQLPKTIQPPQAEQHRPVIPHITPQTSDEGIQSSPSMQSVKSSQRHPARHQVSLEIPWGYRSSGEGDDDSKSMHSWRSTSRVSSRRQSTEDSIDSEDEWYCYELRKLEELEKQTQIERERIDECEDYSPDEHVKEKMSFVLKELRLKASKSQPETAKQTYLKGTMKEDLPAETTEKLTPERVVHDRRPSLERRLSMERRKLPEMPNRRSSFDRCMQRELPQRPNELIQPKEIKPQDFEEDKDQSSGDTSGPDSPHQSFDEMDYEEAYGVAEESRRSSNGYHNKVSSSLSREGSVAPSEMSVSIQGEWNSEDTGTVREGSISMVGSEWENDVREGDSASTITLSAQKSKADVVIKDKEDVHKEEPPKDGGVGSKWKLLKALKDRKAEEKEAKAEAASGSKPEDSAVVVSKILNCVHIIFDRRSDTLD